MRPPQDDPVLIDTARTSGRQRRLSWQDPEAMERRKTRAEAHIGWKRRRPQGAHELRTADLRRRLTCGAASREEHLPRLSTTFAARRGQGQDDQVQDDAPSPISARGPPQ